MQAPVDPQCMPIIRYSLLFPVALLGSTLVFTEAIADLHMVICGGHGAVTIIFIRYWVLENLLQTYHTNIYT